tara:strand:- start:491 stop:1321 length:831 start_codon:yes stop_codon:yes gene_type:complete
MGRRNTVNKLTLKLTAPNYAHLSDAIDKFKNKEAQFYQDRAAELSQYPGMGYKGPNTVERDYDALLGTDPWNYKREFNAANNTEKNDSDQTDDTDDSDTGEDMDSFYVRLPEKLADRIDNPDATDGYGDDEEKYILYNPGTGYKEVDLLYKNVDMFREKGSTGTLDSDRFGGGTRYFEGFGEIPTRYKGNNNMNGRIAHMKRLIGTLWNSQVKPYWDSYNSELNTYNAYVGGGTGTEVITGSDPDNPWDGLTNDFKGYNRIDELSSKLIKEARGYN